MKKFLRFVEIQTKVASVIPFIIGTLFAVYTGATINLLNLGLMFVSLLCIDMATTGLNHYKDYKKAVLKEGYHYEIHNPMGQGAVTATGAKIILACLLSIGAIGGLILFLRTDYIVLILGGISFGIGVTYSAGPLPASRTVLGELFSGLFMGGLIPFISYYIHIYINTPIKFNFTEGNFEASFAVSEILPVFWLSLPMIFLIANIMLANNICDVKEDFINKRYTLPISMGVEKSIILFKLLNLLSVLSILAGVAFKIIPVFILTYVFGFPILYKQTMIFSKNPVKGETFVNAVKNFVLTGLLMIIGLVLSIFLS